MKWYTSSCERPSKSSARVLVPSSVSKRYSVSIGTQGSSRRLPASSSPARPYSFSAWTSSRLAVSHSSRVPVRCSVIRHPFHSSRSPYPYIVSKMANDAFRALAHPLRRDIVERLSGGVATVRGGARGFDGSKPANSRHPKTLEEARVVSRVIDGRSHRLALRPEALAEASDWIETQRERWERLFDVVGEYLEERKGATVTETSGHVVRIERRFA